MQGSNYLLFLVGRLHHWHHDKWPQSCLCHLWSGSHVTVCFKEWLVRLGASVLTSPLDIKCSALYKLKEKSWFLKSPLKNALPLSPTENAIIFPSSFLDSKYTDSQGEIELLHCYATLKTKSQTKFYIEFHSSCLESMGLPIFILSVKVSFLFGLVPLPLALI